jgi:hypothetical protein
MEAAAIEEATAAEEVAAAWRSRPRRDAVGGGVEELGEAPWRIQPRWAAVGLGLLAGGLHRAEAGGRVPALDDGAAAVAIDLSEWAWTQGRAGHV